MDGLCGCWLKQQSDLEDRSCSEDPGHQALKPLRGPAQGSWGLCISQQPQQQSSPGDKGCWDRGKTEERQLRVGGTSRRRQAAPCSSGNLGQPQEELEAVAEGLPFHPPASQTGVKDLQSSEGSLSLSAPAGRGS